MHNMKVTYTGPSSPYEKEKWDKLVASKEEALSEVAKAKKLKNKKAWAGSQEGLDRKIASQQRIADEIEDLLPDEQTRREPDFDLEKWRSRKETLRKMKNSYERERK